MFSALLPRYAQPRHVEWCKSCMENFLTSGGLFFSLPNHQAKEIVDLVIPTGDDSSEPCIVIITSPHHITPSVSADICARRPSPPAVHTMPLGAGGGTKTGCTVLRCLRKKRKFWLYVQGEMRPPRSYLVWPRCGCVRLLTLRGNIVS